MEKNYRWIFPHVKGNDAFFEVYRVQHFYPVAAPL